MKHLERHYKQKENKTQKREEIKTLAKRKVKGLRMLVSMMISNQEEHFKPENQKRTISKKKPDGNTKDYKDGKKSSKENTKNNNSNSK